MKEQKATRREATEWFLTIQAAQEPSAETLQKWLAWLEASEDNRRAFEDVQRVWHGITPAIIARRTVDASEDDYDGSVPVAEWRLRRMNASAGADPEHLATIARESTAPLSREAQRGAGVDSRLPGSSDGFPVRVWRRPLIALAAAAALGGVAFLAQDHVRAWFGPSPVSVGRFATRTGEHMELLLADGSRVTLGGHSTLVVDYTPLTRGIRLEAGEAFFSVRKEARRPFTVRALDGAITAVGTAFNVRAVEDRVTITVTDGTVSVSEFQGPIDPTPGGSPTPAHTPTQPVDVQKLHVERGQQLTYRPDMRGRAFEVTPVRQVDPGESARWRDGWLVYRDEPLKYVIADIARYTDLELAVSDSAAELRFSGAVFKDRIAEWIVALPEVSPVMVEKSPSGTLTIALPGASGLGSGAD